jgi:hypothetical protein
MIYGIIYFIRNNTGVKVSFSTSIPLSDSINNQNRSNIADPFRLTSTKHAKIVKNPKKTKKFICDMINMYHINRDMYDITNKQITVLLNKVKGEYSKDILYLLPDYYNDLDYDDEFKEYEVDSIVTHKGETLKSVRFLIRWKGYDESEDLWLPYSEIRDSKRSTTISSHNQLGSCRS